MNDRLCAALRDLSPHLRDPVVHYLANRIGLDPAACGVEPFNRRPHHPTSYQFGPGASPLWEGTWTDEDRAEQERRNGLHPA